MSGHDLQKQIQLNEIHMDAARDRATSFLDYSSKHYCGMDNQVASAVLAGFHALITHLEYEGGHPGARSKQAINCLENVSEKLGDIMESLDYLAARSDVEETITAHERQLIYRALEADYMSNGQPLNIQDMDSALARYKRIAGLA